ncbi:MAG: SpoVA/SpoVAEb family sporulation membrane protein, partial [Acutalibacteraceae bacterium]
MNRQASPPSPVIKNVLWAFLVGGAICAAGEGIAQWCRLAGLEQTQARAV